MAFRSEPRGNKSGYLCTMFRSLHLKTLQAILMCNLIWAPLIYICFFFSSHPTRTILSSYSLKIWLWFHNAYSMKCVENESGFLYFGDNGNSLTCCFLPLFLTSFPLQKWSKTKQKGSEGEHLKDCFLKNISLSQYLRQKFSTSGHHPDQVIKFYITSNKK